MAATVCSADSAARETQRRIALPGNVLLAVVLWAFCKKMLLLLMVFWNVKKSVTCLINLFKKGIMSQE